MKPTIVNQPPQSKKSTLDSVLSFMDKPLVKVILILFYLIFVSIAVKSQNPIALKSNNMSLSSMNKNIEAANKEVINVNPTLSANSSNISLNVLDKSPKDSVKLIKNSLTKAKTMIAAYFHGVDDADDHYKAKKSGKGLILVTTLLGSPVLGLLPAAVCSSVTPKRKNLDIPSSTVVTNDPYMRGYKNEAHFIKKHNTWPCYVLASIIWVCVVGFIVH